MSTPVDDPPAGGLAGPPPSTWEFDVLAAAEGGGCGLREVAWEIFESTGVTARFGVPDERFQAFLGRMELLYSVENPYHCALHAAVRPDDIAPANYPPASSPKIIFQSRSALSKRMLPY